MTRDREDFDVNIRQAIVDSMFEIEFPTHHEDVVRWLREYKEPANHVDVNGRREELIERLSSRGYIADDWIGVKMDSPSEHLCRWVIGVVMSDISSSGCILRMAMLFIDKIDDEVTDRRYRRKSKHDI